MNGSIFSVGTLYWVLCHISCENFSPNYQKVKVISDINYLHLFASFINFVHSFDLFIHSFVYTLLGMQKSKRSLTSQLLCELKGANIREKGKTDPLVQGWKYKLVKCEKVDYQPLKMQTLGISNCVKGFFSWFLNMNNVLESRISLLWEGFRKDYWPRKETWEYLRVRWYARFGDWVP